MGLRNIYIVDDDNAVRASLQSLLSVKAGSMVRSFRSGDELLECRDELDPGVLLLDVHMPGASGLDVMGALGELRHKFVAIVLTGQGNVELAVQAMKAGAFDFLEKPYEPAALLKTVDAAFWRLERDSREASRVGSAVDKIAALAPRERDVLLGLVDGRQNKVIAYELGLSARTVEIYRANLMDKLGVRNLSEALRIAFAAGLLSDG